jgi:hypothetical protein
LFICPTDERSYAFSIGFTDFYDIIVVIPSSNRFVSFFIDRSETDAFATFDDITTELSTSFSDTSCEDETVNYGWTA